jgi:AAA ATPase domain
MFHSIEVSGYRGFSKYEVRDLGRVNLLVGKNNSGKTSVLEAGYMLGSGGDPAALWRICNRRGERFAGESSAFRRRSEVDVSHLFAGHELAIGQSFSIEGNNRSKRDRVNVGIDDFPEREGEDQPDLIRDEDALSRRRMALTIRSTGLQRQQMVPLSRQGGLELRNAELASDPPGRPNRERGANVHFISTDSLSGDELIRHWIAFS